MIEVERAVTALAAAHEKGTAAADADGAAAEPAAAARGALVWRAHAVFKKAAALFRRHAGLGLMRTAASEWPSLRRDLVELALRRSRPPCARASCAPTPSSSRRERAGGLAGGP